MSQIEQLLSQAAHIGANTKAQIEQAANILKSSRERAEEAKTLLTEREVAASGFDAPRFDGIVQVAALFGGAFNRDSQESRDAAKAMAETFFRSSTGRTDKSLAGGPLNNLTKIVLAGKQASTLRSALSRRLAHYQAMYDSNPPNESPSAKSARQALAKTYLTACGDAPDVEGGSIITAADGSIKTPKFNGRPSAAPNGVVIKYGRGTNRDSQMAGYVDLYTTYGDKVLDDEVIDAFLSNGGRFKPSEEVTIESASAAVLKGLDELLSVGGALSADHGFLLAAHHAVTRIRKEGFRTNVVAETLPPVESTDAPAQDAPEADTLLGAVDTLLAGQEPAQDAPPADGEGVTLGAPATAGRPRRNRKAKEAQPAG